MKVRATQQVYIYNKRMKPGSVFVLTPYKGKKQDGNGKLSDHTFTIEEQFSSKSMEKVEAGTPVSGKSKKGFSAKPVAEPSTEDFEAPESVI